MEAKRSLGQNFFVNENLGKQVVQYIQNEDADIIVEIGPGRGFFTQKISSFAKKLILVEKDDLLFEGLKQRYPEDIVIHKDFMYWDFKELDEYKNKEILFWGSLPYNVSKRIIEKIITSPYFNTCGYFFVQKEVAEKYTSREPNNNLLSVKTKIFADTKKILDIGPESFNPRPHVTSSLIKFTAKKHTEIAPDFFKFLEQCFASPRKTLRNNLRKYPDLETIDEELLNKRPQEVTTEEYFSIFTKKI